VASRLNHFDKFRISCLSRFDKMGHWPAKDKN
jgi:hypothetical protein